MKFYVQTGKSLDTLAKWVEKGRIKKISVNMAKYKYPLTTKQISTLKQLEKRGVVVQWQ